ncbi:MAG: monofunctional biosynthetic peptidoglycan transglycosylase [Gammaproteobacteria bacterium]|nr:monofunctional biosynthetic peptidoglycan transglycosylase [Gammaproteobacteria bacterium]
MNRLFQWLLKFVLKLALVFIVVSIIVVLPFRWINPPITMVMMDRWLHASNEDFALQQQWLSWGEIPKHAASAVMASEDQLFVVHHGFDFDSIADSLKSLGSGQRLRGASTISQQVARNVYLWTGRSWIRKGLEVWFTVLIELMWNKQRILEVYLNIAEWGEGIFGLESASQYHFNHSASQLTRIQSALLASSLPSPLKYKPSNPSPYLIERARWNIKQQQWITGSNYE